MGLIETVARWLSPRTAKGPIDDFWYRPVGATSTAGENVTVESAMGVSTAFACVRLLAEVVGSLPCIVYERVGEDKQRATTHPLYDVLHRRPNAWQTPQQFFEMLVTHVCLRGNFYGRLVTGPRGAVDQIVPLHPDRVTPEQQASGEIVYVYKEATGIERRYAPDYIFHVCGLSTDGVSGVSLLTFARNSLGLAMAQEGHGAGLFKNGALPSFWIKRPLGVKWSDDARKNFRSGWRGMHAGSQNAHNPPILEDGMELMSLGLTNEDSQWVESRGFQGYEICRFFRVQPHLVGILDRATFSNIEHQGLEFTTYTLAPWLTRIAQAMGRDLLADDKRYFVEFLVGALLRGDTKSRYEAYNLAINGGWMTRNEARRKENWNALPGLDTPMEPLNMAPAGSRDGGESTAAVEDDPEDDSPVAMAWSIRPIAEDAAARIVSAEIKMLSRRADKAADDRERWDTWAAGEYERHREYILEVLHPIAASVQWGGSLDEVAAYLIGVSRVELNGRDVSTVLAAWQNEKQSEVAAYLTEVLQ